MSEPERAASLSDHVPLLATKLFAPRPRSGLVARPRLNERLDEALRGPLCLVSAGAGFGKTTLLAEWHQSAVGQDTRLAWLSLDKEDGEPARFWTYFVAALQSARPGFGEGVLALLRSAQPPPSMVLLPLLINELAGLTEDVALVLDDYHLIESVPVQEALTYLVDHLPPRVHLVLLTRADPPLPLARWRARGLLSELRAADLRFTPDEAAAYLGQAVGVTLSATEIATLEARTEGWVVGLQLAALSLRGRADAAEFVRHFAGTNRYILEFLAEEVLSRQPQEVQDFLLQTSVLEQLTARLCDAVLGHPESSESRGMLDTLERSNLFLVPLDDDRSWYRYHHLFTDLLRARLRQTRPDLIPELYSRAGEWCAGEGLIGEAMGYQLAAGNQERAAQLAEQGALEMLRRSDPGFMPMVARLPSEVVRRRPWLAAYRATLDIVWGRWSSARTLLGEAERVAETDSLLPDSGELFPFVRLMSAYLDELQGAQGSIGRAAEAALAAIPRSKHALWNTLAYWRGYSLYLRGDFQDAEEALTRSVQEDLQTGATNAVAANLIAIVRMRTAQGRLRETAELCRQWLRWMDERGRWRFFRSGDLSIGLAEIHRERNELEEALTLVDQGIRDNQLWLTPNVRTYGCVARARVLAAIGQIEPALDLLRELERHLEGLSVLPDLQSELAACRMSLDLMTGDVVSAARWVDDDLLRPGSQPGFRRERDGISLARLLLAQGEPGRALALLARLEAAARPGARTGRLIEILTLRARALHLQKESARALAALGEALTLGEPEGYLRVFVDEGEPVADLLRRLEGLPAATPGSARFSAEYVSRLLAAFGPGACTLPSATPAARPPGHPSSGLGREAPQSSAPVPLIEPLSERELEVLRLMATGLSNREIARKLIVAVGTVKAHVYNISGKLGSQNRVQSIARARDLGLL